MAQTDSALKEVPRLELTATLAQFKLWRTRLTAFMVRTERPLAAFLTGADQPSRDTNMDFAVFILRFLGDDVIQLYDQGDIDASRHGVELYRAVVKHFESAAPLEDTAEEIYLEALPTLKRDRFPSISDFMRHTNNVLLRLERVSGGKVPNIERVLVILALQQLCIGNFCPWAPSILANYKRKMRETPNMSRVDGVTFVKLMDEVSAYTTVASAAGRYVDRPKCTKCNRFGHKAEACRGGKRAPAVSAVSADSGDEAHPADSAALYEA